MTTAQRPAPRRRPKRRRPSSEQEEDGSGPCCPSGLTAPLGPLANPLRWRVAATAVLLASSCYRAEGFSPTTRTHQRLMPSESASAGALNMVGSIRRQPASGPPGGGSPEQIARRNREVLAAAERGDRRGRASGPRRRPPASAAAPPPPPAAADMEPPSALDAAFRTRTASKYEILMPDDITLSSSPRSEAPPPATPEQLENAEARSTRSRVDAKIAALLSDDEDDEDDEDDISQDDLADRRTVYTRLSDAAKSQATAAITKPTPYNPNLVSGTKKRVTAQVQETGRDTIRQSYSKSFTNHELLSRESEAALAREIQMLARWEERRQELEVELMRYVPGIAMAVGRKEKAECIHVFVMA